MGQWRAGTTDREYPRQQVGTSGQLWWHGEVPWVEWQAGGAEVPEAGQPGPSVAGRLKGDCGAPAKALRDLCRLYPSHPTTNVYMERAPPTRDQVGHDLCVYREKPQANKDSIHSQSWHSTCVARTHPGTRHWNGSPIHLTSRRRPVPCLPSAALRRHTRLVCSPQLPPSCEG